MLNNYYLFIFGLYILEYIFLLYYKIYSKRAPAAALGSRWIQATYSLSALLNIQHHISKMNCGISPY